MIEFEVVAVHPYNFFFVPALEEKVSCEVMWWGVVPRRRRVRSGGSRSETQSLGLRQICGRTYRHHRNGNFLVDLFLPPPIHLRRFAQMDIHRDLKLEWNLTSGGDTIELCTSSVLFREESLNWTSRFPSSMLEMSICPEYIAIESDMIEVGIFPSQ